MINEWNIFNKMILFSVGVKPGMATMALAIPAILSRHGYIIFGRMNI